MHGAESFLSQMDQFLAIHGHRTLKEFEINSVRWEEDPTPVIAMIRNYLHSEVNPTEAQEKVSQDRREFVKQIRMSLLDKPLEKQLGFRWRIIQLLSNQAKYFIKLRENSRFYHIMGFYAVRKKILKMEAELIQAGTLKCEDDIFYLRWDELLNLADNNLGWRDVEERIRERRMEFIRLSKMSPPKPSVFTLPQSRNSTRIICRDRAPLLVPTKALPGLLWTRVLMPNCGPVRSWSRHTQIQPGHPCSSQRMQLLWR